LKVFQDYAAYYDLLYHDKNFEREVDFVHQIVQRQRPGAVSMLDLGCGTGAHAAIFAKMGYFVHGVDQSSRMLVHAYRRLEVLAPEVRSRVCFEQNDIRSLKLNKTFDVIVLLFHVVSYQISDVDLRATFATIADHLHPNGIVLFDFWYGPAVIAHPPGMRMKSFEDHNFHISRTANPLMRPDENVVKVQYKFTVTEKATLRCQEFNETHCMRYLFKPELDEFLREAGLAPNGFAEWLSDNVPGCNTWNVYINATLALQNSH
jgi:SAM-dependent methyltransferase